MIIYHIEYNEAGEVDPLLTYDDVDTSFVEEEDSQIRELARSEPHDVDTSFIEAEDSFFEAIIRSEPHD